MSNPLDFITTEDIFDEIENRFEGFIFAAIQKNEPGLDSEDDIRTICRFDGNILSCMGLSMELKRFLEGMRQFVEDD